MVLVKIGVVIGIIFVVWGVIVGDGVEATFKDR